VLALKVWICSAMARAAASTSRKVVCVLTVLAGLTKHGDTESPRQHFAQRLDPLCRQLRIQKIDARQVATQPREAGDKTVLEPGRQTR